MQTYFRITYGMQAVAAFNVLIALFIEWHHHTGSAIRLMLRIFDNFVFPIGLFSAWFPLWVLPLIAFTILIRGASGIFEKRRMQGWPWTLGLCCVACFLMFWFFVNFPGLDGSQRLDETLQNIGVGYWLTLSSLLILVGLVGTEKIIPDVHPQMAYYNSLPPDSPERIWQGLYRPCPFCAAPNNLDAKRCRQCGMLLFPEESP
jgi:hypothetical protein